MGYRADIDGLRAIAILFVLLFHAGLKIVPSGFVGVDIFFVISGFLITNIINESLEKNSFSFIDFYNRRLWRLQPVFICFILITTVFAFFFFLPDDLLQYAKSARKSSVFLANTFFQRITTGYFAPDNHQIPLLHIWSLSIEWQCYLILPLVFYTLRRQFGKRPGRQIIYLLTVLFFIFTWYSSWHYPINTYYQSLSRIFEFLIGSCVALHERNYSFNKYFLNFISLLALFLLFFIATRSNISAGFPNIYALILCLATATLIAAGQQDPKPLSTHCLKLKPLVFIGLLSYSLYLWHWPLFALMHYLSIEETPSVLLLAFSLIFIIAYLSWRFIEKPRYKFKNMKFGYTLMYLFLIPLIMIHLGEYVIKHYEGYPQRFQELVKINSKLKQYEYPQRSLCLQESNAPISSQCMLGAKTREHKTALMIGDSYSNHFWGFMDTLAKEAKVSVLAHAIPACLSLPGLSINDWKARVYTTCHQQTLRYFKMIKTNHYDFVIIGENWNGYLTNKLNLGLKKDGSSEEVHERIEQALDKALNIIIAAGSKPILMKSIALATANPHDCFFEHIKKRERYLPKQCDFRIKAKEQLWQNQLFSRMQKKYPQLIVLDPKTVQCPKGLCKADIKGIPVFRDAGHITDYAAHYLAGLYLKKYKNPLVSEP